MTHIYNVINVFLPNKKTLNDEIKMMIYILYKK